LLLTRLRNILEHVMIDPKDYWFKMSWTQPYDTWPQPAEYREPEITDFAQAREVLARIMAK
jgi:hypothetical protein